MVVEMLVAPGRVGTRGDLLEIGFAETGVQVAPGRGNRGDRHTVVGKDFGAIVCGNQRVGRGKPSDEVDVRGFQQGVLGFAVIDGDIRGGETHEGAKRAGTAVAAVSNRRIAPERGGVRGAGGFGVAAAESIGGNQRDLGHFGAGGSGLGGDVLVDQIGHAIGPLREVGRAGSGTVVAAGGEDIVRIGRIAREERKRLDAVRPEGAGLLDGDIGQVGRSTLVGDHAKGDDAHRGAADGVQNLVVHRRGGLIHIRKAELRTEGFRRSGHPALNAANLLDRRLLKECWIVVARDGIQAFG